MDYYLCYQPNLAWLRSPQAIFTTEQAERIARHNQTEERRAVVFAAGKFIGQRQLTDWGITFSQIPYEIHRTLD